MEILHDEPNEALLALVRISEGMRKDGFTHYEDECERAMDTIPSGNGPITLPITVTSTVTLKNPDNGTEFNPRVTILCMEGSGGCVVVMDDPGLYGLAETYRVATSLSQIALRMRGVSINGLITFTIADEDGNVHKVSDILHRIRNPEPRQRYTVQKCPYTNTELLGGTPEERTNLFMPVVSKNRNSKHRQKEPVVARGVSLGKPKKGLTIRIKGDPLDEQPVHSANWIGGMLFATLIRMNLHVQFKDFGNWLIADETNPVLHPVSEYIERNNLGKHFTNKNFDASMCCLLTISTEPLTLEGMLARPIKLLERIGEYSEFTRCITFTGIVINCGSICNQTGKSVSLDELVRAVAAEYSTTPEDIRERFK